MDFNDEEKKIEYALLQHSLFGLRKENLVEGFIYGDKDRILKTLGLAAYIPEDGGILVTPSALGAELFLWVHGQGNINISSLFKTNLPVPDGISPCESPESFNDLRNKLSKKDNKKNGTSRH